MKKDCPVLSIRICCPKPECNLMRVSIHNSAMEEEDGEIVPVAYFPLEKAAELIERVRAFAASKGIEV
jgi:hypothetical protein